MENADIATKMTEALVKAGGTDTEQINL